MPSQPYRSFQGDVSVFAAGNCTVDHFRCQSEHCIEKAYLCDGYFDCADGDDELDCEVCPKNYTQCNVSVCIPKNATCDGVDDCGDGSDEVGCSESAVDVLLVCFEL